MRFLLLSIGQIIGLALIVVGFGVVFGLPGLLFSAGIALIGACVVAELDAEDDIEDGE